MVTPADFTLVLKACESGSAVMRARNQAIVWLFIESGLRRFEVCALDLADIDLKDRTVVVRKGKNSKARVRVFGDETAKALWRYLKQRGKRDGPLFVSAQGGRLSPSGMTGQLNRIKKHGGVQVRPHMFRHTWANASFGAGMAEHDFMTLAGWSKSDMVARYGAALAT